MGVKERQASMQTSESVKNPMMHEQLMWENLLNHEEALSYEGVLARFNERIVDLQIVKEKLRGQVVTMAVVGACALIGLLHSYFAAAVVTTSLAVSSVLMLYLEMFLSKKRMMAAFDELNELTVELSCKVIERSTGHKIDYVPMPKDR